MCQPGRPEAPGAVPGRLARLGGLPDGEVERVGLAGLGVDAHALRELVDALLAELAVLVEAAHAEVHAAVGRVGVVGADELADEVDDLGDGLGGPGLDVRARDPEPVGVHDVGGGVLLGHGRRVPPLGIGLVDDLVVHVGDVGDQRDVEAAVREPGAQDGEGDVGARVADVHQVVDRGAAAVDAGLAGVAGLERLLLLGQRVEEADHGWSPGVGVDSPAGFPARMRSSRARAVSRSRAASTNGSSGPVLGRGERDAQRHEQVAGADALLLAPGAVGGEEVAGAGGREPLRRLGAQRADVRELGRGRVRDGEEVRRGRRRREHRRGQRPGRRRTRTSDGWKAAASAAAACGGVPAGSRSAKRRSCSSGASAMMRSWSSQSSLARSNTAGLDESLREVELGARGGPGRAPRPRRATSRAAPGSSTIASGR